MNYKLIGCYDVLLKAYMPLQCVNDMLDEDIVESNRRAVLLGQIPVDKAKRLIVIKFGTFNDKTGDLELCEPEKLCNLADFIPRTEVKVEDKLDGTINN